MTTLVITTNVSNPDAEDREVMEAAIDRWNEPIIAQNLILAAQDPPGTPLALLPKSTGPERKASYEIYLARNDKLSHESYVAQLRAAKAERQEIRAIRDAVMNASQEVQNQVKAILGL